ncbi:MAG: O-antigen ligase family protein [bacterium]
MDNIKKIKILDTAIFVFVIIFLASLTNSIFVNQIGYYGALVLVLIKFCITKENPFTKNGLGIAVLLFLTAELISALLSDNQSNAFNNVLKRALLIPLLYLFSAVVNSEERGKLIIKIFIGSAILMITAYLVVAYNYVAAKLYIADGTGPKFINIVMTTGGIISFIAIILFAFLINEKVNLKYRLLLFVFFLMASISLIANYSRAAWLGCFVGIITVLLVKRKWLIVLLPFAAVILYVFFVKNQSYVAVYKTNNGVIKQIEEIQTDGRASSVCLDNNKLVVADYQNGVIIIKDKKIIDRLSTPVPAVWANKWTDEYYSVHLLDSRNIIVKKDKNKLHQVGEYISKGLTVNSISLGNKLYIADIDSGLTIMLNPNDLTDRKNFKQINWFVNFSVNKNYLSYYSKEKEKLCVYSCVDGIPDKEIYSYKIKTLFTKIFQADKYLLFQEDDGLKVFNIDSNKVITENGLYKNIKSIVIFFMADGVLHGLNINGELYKFEYNNKLTVQKYKGNIKSVPLIGEGLYASGDTIYCAYHKMNRIGSLLDPYHNSNFSRIRQWITGFRIFKDYPIFGVGDIDLMPMFNKYKDKYENETFGHLHNNYVQLLVILGLFGFTAVMFLFYKIFTLNIKIYKQVKTIPFVSSYSLGVLGMFIGFLFSGLAEWNFGDHEIITMVWFFIGMNLAFYNLSKNKTKESNG